MEELKQLSVECAFCLYKKIKKCKTFDQWFWKKKIRGFELIILKKKQKEKSRNSNCNLKHWYESACNPALSDGTNYHLTKCFPAWWLPQAPWSPTILINNNSELSSGESCMGKGDIDMDENCLRLVIQGKEEASCHLCNYSQVWVVGVFTR